MTLGSDGGKNEATKMSYVMPKLTPSYYVNDIAIKHMHKIGIHFRWKCYYSVLNGVNANKCRIIYECSPEQKPRNLLLALANGNSLVNAFNDFGRAKTTLLHAYILYEGPYNYPNNIANELTFLSCVSRLLLYPYECNTYARTYNNIK